MKPEVFGLWDDSAALPGADALAFPEHVRDVVVHRAGHDRYGFLHDCAIVHHEGTLYAAWYNCPRAEIVDEASVRGRRSTDGGRTWSEVAVLASDTAGRGVFYVPVVFLSHGGELYAYVANMTGHDRVTCCEVFQLTADAWVSHGPIADCFLPNSPPVRMDDDTLIMGGRIAKQAGMRPQTPAVAIGRRSDPSRPWQTLPIDGHGEIPAGAPLPYPETALIVEGRSVFAIVRNDHGNALVCTSSDCGQHWSPPREANFPIGAAKMCAGMLSTGQRYLVFNTPTTGYRDLLTIAVSRPGERVLSGMWKLRDGHCKALQATPEWSYPCAIEQEGDQYIVYTSEKRHCVLSVVPTASLWIE